MDEQQPTRTDSAGQEIECPWCQSGDVSVRSLYGGSAAEILMQCNSCKTPFGWMKWHAKAAPVK